jgi:hypothetical protein
MAEAVAQGVAQTASAGITVFRDGDDICCGRPGNTIYGQAVVMPNGGPDDYASRLTGRIVVDDKDGIPGETIRLTFGLFADDGCEIRIVGQDFLSAANTTGDGVARIVEVDGDGVLTADYWTGNTQAFGIIDLKEGEYDIVGHHFEGGGDSGYEVWFAVGEYTSLDATAFRPITTNSGFYIPPNTGVNLGVTPNPDLDGDGIPGVWEAAFGLSDSNPADALLDGDRDGQSNLQEYAAGTNPNDANSSFQITRVQFTPGEIALTFQGVQGRGYQIVASPSLTGGWVPIGEVPVRSADGEIRFPVTHPFYVDAAARGKMFFSVVATPYP